MPDVWIVVFDFMPVKELLSVSHTCREMWLLVKVYWPLAFNLALSHPVTTLYPTTCFVHVYLMSAVEYYRTFHLFID